MSEEVMQRITGHTELLGLIAYPIRHSHSPRMHNLAASKLGLDYAYLCFDVDHDNLEEAVAGLKALKVRGWNVSMPNKIKILDYVDKLSPAVELIGASNTIVNDDGVLTAYNTDGVGSMEALRFYGHDPKDATITLIGAGGAGTAIACQAGLDGVKKLNIFNQKDDFWPRAEDNVEKVRRSGAEAVLMDLADKDALAAALAESSVLIDATNVGMGALEGQTNIPDISIIPRDMFVMHIVYSPEVTKLLADCKEAGIECANGMEMMYRQGAASFKYWTGVDMPLDYVKEHLFN